MSKPRPHAHIYEKWVRGIRAAVTDAEERCGLYEHIFAYQFAKVYGTAEQPRVQDLSSAAALAFTMLEGDLEELCEARKENNSKRAQNGLRSTPSSPEQPLLGASRPLQDNTIQDNTIQDNTIQSNNNAMQALKNLAGRGGALDEFSLGLALLRKGYIIKAADLHSKYARAAAANNPVSYAAKGLTKAANPAALNVATNYLEATGCRDTRALELYGAKMTEENGARVLEISCTADARDAIGTAGQDKAQGYLQSIGATAVSFWINGQ